jgi:tetratricopeptide (TPR) repeat protein
MPKFSLLVLTLLLAGINSTLLAQEEETPSRELFQTATFAFDSQDWENAKRLLSTWITTNPRDAEGYWLRGQTFEHLGNLDRALADFSILLTIDSEYAEAYFARGRIRYQLNQYESAMKDFQDFLVTPPGQTTRIIYRQSAGDLGVSQVITAQSGNPAQAYYHLGLCNFELGEYDFALDYFDLALQAEPENPDYYAEKGRSYLRVGENMLAIESFEEALSINPSHLPARQGLAQVKEGGDLLLLEQLDQAIADSIANSQTYKQRGFYRMNHGDSIGAIADFSAAIDLDEFDTESFYYRGKIYFGKKNWKKAEYDFSAALELEEQNEGYLLARGQSRYLAGSLDGALADFTLLIAIEPSNPSGFYHRGITLQRMRRLSEACPDLLKASELGMEQAIVIWGKICEPKAQR